MPDIPMHDDEFAAAIARSLKRTFERTSFTGGGTARLGNGDTTNPTVHVADKPGYVYVYEEVDGTNNVYQVYDPLGIVPLGNGAAADVVFYGYRPGESKDTGGTPVIYSRGQAAGAFEMFSGFPPSLLEDFVNQFVRPDKFRWMHVLPRGGFLLYLNGGWGRHGNTRVKIPTQEFMDVGSYQPTGTDEALYLACYYNVVTGEKSVIAGTTFTHTGEVNHNTLDEHMPVAIPSNCIQVGWVLLRTSMTKIRDVDIHWSPDIFFVPDATLSPTPTYLVDDANNPLLDDIGDFLLAESA